METAVKIGDAVIYGDVHGKEHSAIVTQVWGVFGTYREHVDEMHITPGSYYTNDEKYVEALALYENKKVLDEQMPTPSINLVYVVDDASKTDPYGRQIERTTSVPPQSVQTAHGMYWRNV